MVSPRPVDVRLGETMRPPRVTRRYVPHEPVAEPSGADGTPRRVPCYRAGRNGVKLPNRAGGPSSHRQRSRRSARSCGDRRRSPFEVRPFESYLGSLGALVHRRARRGWLRIGWLRRGQSWQRLWNRSGCSRVASARARRPPPAAALRTETWASLPRSSRFRAKPGGKLP